MAIDYSKWDKIELSDDSDIEVHPNVDKKSFIKWKQRDIHEKREKRNGEIKTLLVQLSMYAQLNLRLDYLLSKLTPEQWLDQSVVTKTLNEKFDPNQRFNYHQLLAEKGDTLRKGLRDLTFEPQELENIPPYNEMIEDLCTTIKADEPGAANDPQVFLSHIKNHRARIDNVLSLLTIKLDELLNEKASLISSDDLKPGFDRSIMNKDGDNDDDVMPTPLATTKPASDPKASADNTKPLDGNAPPSKETITSTAQSAAPSNTKASVPDTASASASAPATSTAVSGEEEADELMILPETAIFGRISETDLGASATYLMKHTRICSEQQKDALLMTAFELFLDENDAKTAHQIVHQALLLQYIALLAGANPLRDLMIRAIKLFCTKVSDNSSQAKKAFAQDVQNTFSHIQTRCQVIAKERAERSDRGEGDDEDALIQLKSLDEGTELSVNIPNVGTHEYEVFSSKLSQPLQDAVQTQSLEQVNAELAKLSVSEAERVLDVFNECGVIGVSGYLENEQDFEQLQREYQETKNENVDNGQVNAVQSLADEVD